MTAVAIGVARLRQQRPEWAPWLAPVEETLREAATSRWDAAVPSGVPTRSPDLPLLAGASVCLDASDVRRLLRRLTRLAARSGAAQLASVRTVGDADVNVLALFAAALCHDAAPIDTIAHSCGSDPEALQAVSALLTVPFLQACHRAWAPAVGASWMKGYCPVCGAWPAFAEVRGIERARYLRCARCGAGWHAHALTCPFCATSEHGELAALVPADNALHASIEACMRCSGYLKSLTTLQGCAPDAVMLEDFASVALDIAALEHEYSRPHASGYPFAVTVTHTRQRRRWFGVSL